jgi:hypothetical protein
MIGRGGIRTTGTSRSNGLLRNRLHISSDDSLGFSRDVRMSVALVVQRRGCAGGGPGSENVFAKAKCALVR